MNTQLVSDSDFQERVDEVVQSLGGPNPGFPKWFLRDLIGLEGSEVDFAVCDPTHDFGLDAFYSDDDFFYLLQFKYHHPASNSQVTMAASSPANELRNCWPIVSNIQKATEMWSNREIHETLFNAAQQFQRDVVGDTKKVKMVVVEFTKGDTSDAEDWYKELVMNLQNNHHFADPPVDIINFHSLVNLWTQAYLPSTRIQELHEIDFVASQGVLEYIPHGGISPRTHRIGEDDLIDGTAIAVNIMGIRLANLYELPQVRDRLFDPNVRFELLQGSEFKDDVKKTIQNNADRFWHFNNGITILCRDFEITGSNTIKIVAPGVVNGCQTIKQLHRTHPTNNLEVLVKIIKSENSDFDRNVALYTNTQNPVTKRDLLSGRDEQKFYYKAFGELKHPWFLEIKRGSWATLQSTEQNSFKASVAGRGTKPRRILTNEYVLSASIAFICQDPVVSKTNKQQWWEKKHYDEVFKHQRSAYELVSIALIHRALENLKNMRDSSANSIYPKLSYCVPHLCALIGYAILTKYPSIGEAEWERIYDHLMDQTTQFPREDSFVKVLVDNIFVHFLDDLYMVTETAAASTNPPQTWDAAKYFKNQSKWNGIGVPDAFLPFYKATIAKRIKQGLASPESMIP